MPPGNGTYPEDRISDTRELLTNDWFRKDVEREYHYDGVSARELSHVFPGNSLNNITQNQVFGLLKGNTMQRSDITRVHWGMHNHSG